MKYATLLFIFSIILITTTEAITVAPTMQVSDEESYMIPDEAVRLRILAHSDARADQELKLIVRDRVNEDISKRVAQIDDIDTARQLIEQSIPNLNQIVRTTLAEYDQNYPFTVEYNENVPFPLKKYGPYVYPEGDYEAILITLGSGLGENWWCVLFPPLCFIDFFNDTKLVEADLEGHEGEEGEIAPTGEEEEVEVRFFLFDLFNFS